METHLPPPESDIPDEYLLADKILVRFADSLAHYPDVQKLPLHTTLQKYLDSLSEIVARFMPFDHHGTGVAPIKDQAVSLMGNLQLPQPIKSLGFERTIDCKLPATVMAYLVRALATEHGWPLTAELVLRGGSYHAYARVKVDPSATAESVPFHWEKGTDYMIDFESDKGISWPKATPHDGNALDKVVERKRVSSEPDFIQGMIQYDKRYYGEDEEDEKAE